MLRWERLATYGDAKGTILILHSIWVTVSRHDTPALTPVPQSAQRRLRRTDATSARRAGMHETWCRGYGGAAGQSQEWPGGGLCSGLRARVAADPRVGRRKPLVFYVRHGGRPLHPPFLRLPWAARAVTRADIVIPRSGRYDAARRAQRHVGQEVGMPAQRKLLFAVFALVAVFLVGAWGYQLIEDDVSFGEAAYMTIITISTTGFENVWELDSAGRIWTSLIIVFGIAVVTVAFTSLVAVVVGGELRGVMGRRSLQNKIAKYDGHYIVCGYGRMGKLICDDLQNRGKKIVVIEQDDKRTVIAEESGVAYVLGDATNEDTLRDAGIDRAGGLVTVLDGDADNVFVTLTAAGMRKDMPIISRAEYFDSEPKLKRAGATHVVCPQAIGAVRIANLMARPAIAHFVDITTGGSDWEIDEVLVPADSALVGRSLRDLKLRKHSNAMVVAIRGKNGDTKVSPDADRLIQAGEVLVVIGPTGIADALLDFELGDD